VYSCLIKLYSKTTGSIERGLAAQKEVDESEAKRLEEERLAPAEREVRARREKAIQVEKDRQEIEAAERALIARKQALREVEMDVAPNDVAANDVTATINNNEDKEEEEDDDDDDDDDMEDEDEGSESAAATQPAENQAVSPLYLFSGLNANNDIFDIRAQERRSPTV
jgi:hypothetical protein